MTDRDTVAHLLRRLTFGPTAAEVDAALETGVDATLDAVLAPVGRTVALPDVGPFDRKDARRQSRDAVRWWLRRMVNEPGGAEKLTFFWHGHWATSVQKVRSAPLMLAQQQTLRRYGGGDTGPLVRAMLRDPALILWLDGQRNTRTAPNENLARELMELFTLGVGAYTEDDVKAGARALTGWRASRAGGTATFVPGRHDPGPVTLLGRTGTVDADTYADLLVRHPAHLPHLVTRLWVRYGSGTAPDAATIARVTAAGGRSTTGLLRAIATDPAFAATAGQLVKQPVEWLIGAARQLGIDAGALPDRALRALGQVPFRPPSVGGWPVGTAWLTTSSTRARLEHAQKLTALAPDTVAELGRTAPAGRLDALARLLAVDGWSERTRAVLADSAADPRRLLALGLASPEYAVH
ncbi:DUF1800 domain-containing protein [Nucisporomicrobium flavum]|uniref:DUF1800 domain-containing protein n=1 Tax=Nucisporomicrobium flavum TaxID=2785915 RepID=UPI0018F291C2|nr:DUF1800 domain-containing protein [Nucisporomicrobium flavum]